MELAGRYDSAADVVEGLAATGVDVTDSVRDQLVTLSLAAQEEAAANGLSPEDYQERLRAFVAELSRESGQAADQPDPRRHARPGLRDLATPRLHEGNIETVLTKVCKFWPFC